MSHAQASSTQSLWVTRSLQALGLAALAVAAYIWLRVEWQVGVGALLRLVHDVTLTLGLFSLTGLEFDLNIVAALLTRIGYSLNDTIVVYDRIQKEVHEMLRARKSVWFG